jgi:hypothetical protein
MSFEDIGMARQKHAIDKIAQKLKSRLEETDHQVVIKIGEDESGYWLNFNIEKLVNGRIWARHFALTDTSPTPTRHPRFRMIFKYDPKMNLDLIFKEVRIDHSRLWPTDMMWDPAKLRSIRPRD